MNLRALWWREQNSLVAAPSMVDPYLLGRQQLRNAAEQTSGLQFQSKCRARSRRDTEKPARKIIEPYALVKPMTSTRRPRKAAGGPTRLPCRKTKGLPSIRTASRVSRLPLTQYEPECVHSQHILAAKSTPTLHGIAVAPVSQDTSQQVVHHFRPLG